MTLKRRAWKAHNKRNQWQDRITPLQECGAILEDMELLKPKGGRKEFLTRLINYLKLIRDEEKEAE